MLGRILNKLRKSCRRRGVLGTVGYALGRVAHPLLELTPARRRQRWLKEQKDRAFDARYGVDTGGIIQLSELGIEGDTWEYGVPYWATDPDDFAKLIGELDVRHEEYTFVDFGSGKGRVLLLASDYPFKKIVGVEFSAELDRVARRNVAAFLRARPQCPEIELVCADALKYPLPDGPGVYYFYNPFEKEIMERMVARIEQSYRERPRDIYVLYANSKHSDVWDRAACFRPVTRTDYFAVYTTAAPGREEG
jgi:SAM-dependent methyltransferase